MKERLKSLNLSCKYLMIVFLLCICLGFFATKPYNDKTPIRQATICQIDCVHEIGYKLSKEIYDYINKNDVTDINQLINIKGVGEKRLEYLKEVFK